MQGVFETIFDVAYLGTVIFLGIKMIAGSAKKTQYLLYGVMAVVLGFGDAFHLVPRAIALCTTGLDQYTYALGLGKLITSITMTAFYVLLYYVWRERYAMHDKNTYTLAVWVFALSRILLCVLPYNEWFTAKPPVSWGIYRNIPFTLLGVLLIVLWYKKIKESQDHVFRFLPLAVAISFICYIPVVLWSNSLPIIGALMIPKTCAYIWVIFIGYNAMKKELTK